MCEWKTWNIVNFYSSLDGTSLPPASWINQNYSMTIECMWNLSTSRSSRFIGINGIINCLTNILPLSQSYQFLANIVDNNVIGTIKGNSNLWVEQKKWCRYIREILFCGLISYHKIKLCIAMICEKRWKKKWTVPVM